MTKSNAFFQALADPTRRQILKLLQHAEQTPGELLEHFVMTKPSLSHHLDILKKADLVETRRQGQNIYYSLKTSVFEDVVAFLLDFTGKPISKAGTRRQKKKG